MQLIKLIMSVGSGFLIPLVIPLFLPTHCNSCTTAIWETAPHLDASMGSRNFRSRLPGKLSIKQ